MKKFLFATLSIIGISLIITPAVILTGCSKSSQTASLGYVPFKSKSSNQLNASSTTDYANDSTNYNAIELAQDKIKEMTAAQVKKEVENSIGEYYCAFEFESETSNEPTYEYEIEKVQFVNWDPSMRKVTAKFFIEVEQENNDEEVIVDRELDFTLDPMFSNLTLLVSNLQAHENAGNPNLDVEDLAELYDEHFQTNIEDYFEEGKSLNIDNDTTILGYALKPLIITGSDSNLNISLDDSNPKIFCPTLNNNYVFYLEGTVHPKK